MTRERVSYISRNYLIRVITFDEKGRQISRLRGVSSICNMIGEDLFMGMINRIERKGSMKERNKLRRGIWVDIYYR